MKVLAAILGGGMSSRLFTEIREKRGLCYYIKTAPQFYTDHGYLVVQAGIDNKKVAEAIQAILAEFEKIKSEKIPNKEIKKAKEFLKGKLSLGLETTVDMAGWLAEQEILRNKIESIAVKNKKIDKVTLKDLQRVARKYFTNNKLNLAIIGPHSKKDKFQNILNKCK